MTTDTTPMTISTRSISELRARTGAGIMDCKQALEDAQGDPMRAAEILRAKGIAKAEKRAGRDASQGLVIIESTTEFAGMVELDCETDFVARTDGFQRVAQQLASHVLASSPAGVTLDAFARETIEGQSIDDLVKGTAARTGEAVAIKRVAKFGAAAGVVGVYRHHNRQVGTIVELSGATGDAAIALANDLALHIASADPVAIEAADLPSDMLERERRIATEHAAESEGTDDDRRRMIDDELRRVTAERALMEQPWVRDGSVSVRTLVSRVPGARVLRFARFKVGEA